MTRRSKHLAGVAAAGAGLAAVTAVGLTERTAVAASLTVLAHLHWPWIPAALLLEAASMGAFALMLRRLLAAGGTSVGVRPMLATSLAANAVSVSVPLAGPALATAFTFRRFTRQGADVPLAGWSLLAGGVISAAAAALVVVAGGLASGNILATAVTVPGGVLVVAALVAAVAAVRRPRLRGALERPAGWLLRQGSVMLHRPVAEPSQTIGAWAQRLGALRLSPAGWLTATGLALANWLTDAAVLAVSIRATGGTVPWHDLLLVYGSGITAQSLNITPGGLGVTEGSLSLALVATGLTASQALAAVLLYRFASFWLVALAGWLILVRLRRPRARRDPTPSRNRAVAGPAAAAAGDAHEVVLLHGQPGSPADWQLVTRRLPAQLHAIAADRPGYGSSQLPAGGFAANARAVLDDLDSRGVTRAVLVGHSYGGGVALSAASLAPGQVAAVVLLASVGPGCVTSWDRLLAAPGAGQLCALVAWRLTPWLARARLTGIAWRRGRPLDPDEHINWQVWGHAGHGQRPLWRTFLTEQRALLRELDELEDALPSVRVPVLVLADPRDTIVPFETARRLVRALPDARLQLVEGAGHHLPRRAPDAVADAIVASLAAAQVTEGGEDKRGTYPSRPCESKVGPDAGGDHGDHRRAGCRGGTGRRQADLNSGPFDRQRVAGVLRHRPGRSRPSRPPRSPGLAPARRSPRCRRTDVYTATATLSLRTARYQSTELTLRTTELTDNAGRPLQAQTRLDTSLINTFDVPPYVNSADQPVTRYARRQAA